MSDFKDVQILILSVFRLLQSLSTDRH